MLRYARLSGPSRALLAAAAAVGDAHAALRASVAAAALPATVDAARARLREALDRLEDVAAGLAADTEPSPPESR